MAEAIAEIEGMDSSSRAGPNLHYGEDWTYQLQDTPLKRLMEPDPQMQTGEWLLHSRELQDTEDQFHQKMREPEVERLREVRGEPGKRADQGRRSAQERSQVLAKNQEAGRREARSKSINHRRNLSAAWDRDSPSPPPTPAVREERVNPKEKELHTVARSKVKTNPRTRSTPRKIKDVMTHGETQRAAVAPSCCERVKVNQKLSRPQSPVKTNTRDLPPNTGGEIHKSAEASSRAGTRRSRQGKSSTGPARTIAPSPRSRSPLSRTAKDRGMAARIANPESEGEYSDPGDPDYTVVSDGGERAEESEADTLVPGAVQHVRQTGYPSPRRVKKNKAVKKSVDVNEKSHYKYSAIHLRTLVL